MKHPLLLAALTLSLVACTTKQAEVPVLEVPSMGKRAAMEWWAKETGTDEYGMPHNELTLRIDNTGETLYTTECNGTTLVQDVPDMEGAVAYIQCWWAGGGDQFAVFIGDAEKAVIRHRTVDEEAGYGQWEDLKAL